jgi:hypothetical protein
MAMDTIVMLAADPQLLARFRSDPLGMLSELQEQTGGKSLRLSASDIELIKSLTPEEFQLLYGIAAKMKNLKIPNFRL